MGEIILVASIGFMPYFCAIRFQSFGRGRDSGGRASVLRTAPGRFPICGRGMLGGGGGPGTKRRGCAARCSLSRTITILTRGRGDEKEKNQTNRRDKPMTQSSLRLHFHTIR